MSSVWLDVVLCRYAVDFCYIVNIYILSSAFFSQSLSLSPSLARLRIFAFHEYVHRNVHSLGFHALAGVVPWKERKIKNKATTEKNVVRKSKAKVNGCSTDVKPTDRKWQRGEITTTKIEVNIHGTHRHKVGTQRQKTKKKKKVKKAAKMRVGDEGKTSMKHERCNVVIKIIFVKPIGDNK